MGVTAGIVEFGHIDNTGQEGPHLVRLRKADLQRRINGQLTLRYKAEGLTSFAGLELVGRFIRRLDLRAILKGVEKVLPRSDFGAARLSLLVLTMLIAGARRVRQVENLRDDPLVERVCGLCRLPSLHSLGRWLRGFDAEGVKALVEVNERLVGDVIKRSGLRRLTLDVDGSVVSTGLKVEGARRGFNPHRRKVPSYYPITAYEANTGQVLRACNRAGNVHDGKASVTFLEEVFAQLDATLDRRSVLEMRMDGAFFREDVLDVLDAEGVQYAIKAPFWQWLRVPAWSRRMRVVVYRKRVRHRSAKNYQLDLFDPDDGYFEYSAIVTNKEVTGRTLWFFMCGRGAHEKVYGELKGGFTFDCVLTRRYEANSA